MRIEIGLRWALVHASLALLASLWIGLYLLWTSLRMAPFGGTWLSFAAFGFGVASLGLDASMMIASGAGVVADPSQLWGIGVASVALGRTSLALWIVALLRILLMRPSSLSWTGSPRAERSSPPGP